jgi:hypothetical protein
MLRAIVAAVVIGLSSLAIGQTLTLNDVKAKGGKQLTAEDVAQLLPGAKVVSRTNTGSTRSWENKADGTLVASSDNRGNPGYHGAATASGTWRLSDKGAYCVTIAWQRVEEKWCRFIFKTGDKYYGVNKLEDGAAAFELDFQK